MDKQAKKRRLREWRAAERADGRAALPLPDSDMHSLFDTLDAELSGQGCDHTLRFCLAWLQEHGHAPDLVVAWLHDHGGFCDCEVLANAEEAWQEARAGT
jgi:hypothetical protein